MVSGTTLCRWTIVVNLVCGRGFSVTSSGLDLTKVEDDEFRVRGEETRSLRRWTTFILEVT